MIITRAGSDARAALDTIVARLKLSVFARYFPLQLTKRGGVRSGV
jgi:hypothetical protein